MGISSSQPVSDKEEEDVKNPMLNLLTLYNLAEEFIEDTFDFS